MPYMCKLRSIYYYFVWFYIILFCFFCNVIYSNKEKLMYDMLKKSKRREWYCVR